LRSVKESYFKFSTMLFIRSSDYLNETGARIGELTEERINNVVEM